MTLVIACSACDCNKTNLDIVSAVGGRYCHASCIVTSTPHLSVLFAPGCPKNCSLIEVDGISERAKKAERMVFFLECGN